METVSSLGLMSAWHDGQMTGLSANSESFPISGGTVPHSNGTGSCGTSRMTGTLLPQFGQERHCLSGSHSMNPPQLLHSKLFMMNLPGL